MLTIDEIICHAEPAVIAESLRHEPYMCLLDSSLGSTLSRWSFACAKPFMVLTAREGRVYLDGRDAGADPFAILSALLDEHALPADVKGPPFVSGAAGFLSYDLGRYLEKVPSMAEDDLPQPDMCLAFYDCVLSIDNLDRRVWISYLPSGREKAEAIKAKITCAKPTQHRIIQSFRPGADIDWSNVESNFSRNGYIQAIQKVKDYIAEGDVYQINLSQRFSAPFEGDAWQLYNALRQVNPSPFGCYLDFPELTLASASPERLINLDGQSRLVETRPIKGTRPRGRTPAEDEQLALELAASEKDRAENLMIVDMERNDLGRVCEFSSISVPSLWHIERHPNVFQMVSTVQGRLSSKYGPAELLAACFPGGSITGAPKIRAMEIIEELEPTRRGIYTGSVGYIDFRGNIDFNIVIRSLILCSGKAYFHGGGGIITDSIPENEYQETIDKVSGLVSTLNHFSESSIMG